MKILFLTKKRSLYGSDYSYGASTGLFNSASFVVNALQDFNIDAQIKDVNDANDIDREVTIYNPNIVIIEAIWVTPEKIEELLRIFRHQSRKWIIRLHSKPSFIANEGNAFDWIAKYSSIAQRYSNFALSVNTEEFTQDIAKLFNVESVYLPNIYYLRDKTVVSSTPINNRNVINIGLFGSIRPMKNHLTQAISAIKFADKIGKQLRLHINSSRHEQGGEQVHKNLRALFANSFHELIEHDWLNHTEFLRLVKQMDFGMQVSLTETFNIVVADFVHVRVPIIVSDEIDWLDPVFRVDNYTSTEVIKDKLLEIYYNNDIKLKLLAKNSLSDYNYKATKIWLDWIISNY